MIKTLIKLKIFKLILIGGVSSAYIFKKYCDQKNEIKSKKDKKLFDNLGHFLHHKLALYIQVYFSFPF